MASADSAVGVLGKGALSARLGSHEKALSLLSFLRLYALDPTTLFAHDEVDLGGCPVGMGFRETGVRKVAIRVSQRPDVVQDFLDHLPRDARVLFRGAEQ